MSVDGCEQELDSHDARADFENLLQGILAKANASEKLTSDQEDDRDSSLEEKESSQKSQRPAVSDSPQKPSTPKQSKKRRKKEEHKEEKVKPNSFIMKLFDRSVDLASFNDDTPLYTMCRAWMENDPSGKKAKSNLNGGKVKEDELMTNSEDDELSGHVTSMPPPNSPWDNVDASGRYKSPRVPERLPQPQDRLERYLTNECQEPPAELLLSNHLQHWRKIRETWRRKSHENDARYRDGMDLLRDIFQRNLYNNSASQ